ncbi:MAG: GAF domain-containing protein, partial [Ilumatobacteraceae bacterium]
LAAIADGLGPVLAPADHRAQLVDLCGLVRDATGAASVSVARLDGDELVYDAAKGNGDAAITGVRLPTSRGIAGYVARTGQSLVIDQVQSDPRFARDVAERVGYVPTSLLVVPIVDADDEVLGVLSVLDRTHGAGDPLEVASAAARVAAPIVATSAAVTRLGPLLLRAVADAVAADEARLAGSLRRLADRVPEPDDELVALAALLAEVRALPEASQRGVQRVLREALALAAAGSRRRW